MIALLLTLLSGSNLMSDNISFSTLNKIIVINKKLLLGAHYFDIKSVISPLMS